MAGSKRPPFDFEDLEMLYDNDMAETEERATIVWTDGDATQLSITRTRLG